MDPYRGNPSQNSDLTKRGANIVYTQPNLVERLRLKGVDLKTPLASS